MDAAKQRLVSLLAGQADVWQLGAERGPLDERAAWPCVVDLLPQSSTGARAFGLLPAQGCHAPIRDVQEQGLCLLQFVMSRCTSFGYAHRGGARPSTAMAFGAAAGCFQV